MVPNTAETPFPRSVALPLAGTGLGRRGGFAVLLAAALLAVLVGALPLGPFAIGVAAVVLLVASFAAPRVALALLILSIPFSSYTKVSLGAFDVTATDALVGILMVRWLIPALVGRRLDLRVGPTVVTSIVLLTAMLLSSVMASDFPSAVKEMVKIAEVAAVALYVASHVHTSGDVRFVLLMLLAAGAAEAGVGLFQFVTARGPETFALGPFIRAYGDFSQPNAYAGYLSMILPFGVAMLLAPNRERLLVAGATLMIAAGIAASMSRGAWVGVAVALALSALIWSPTSRRALGAAVAVGMAAVVLGVVGLVPQEVTERIAVLFENFFTFDAASVELTSANFALVQRLAHWQAAWAMLLANPVLGVGPGNFDVAYDLYHLQRWPDSLGHAHNYYLNTLAEGGLVGFAALIGFMAAIFVRIGQAIRRAGSGPTISRAASIGALGAAVTLSAHNAFDNMLVHGIGVQFGLALGIVEAIAFEMGVGRANSD